MKPLLIIEPDSSERGFFRKMFSKDYLLTFAKSAREAPGIMAASRFPVVIFDLGNAGIEYICELRLFKNNHGNNSMIIAISSRNNLTIEKGVASAGVFYHLLKPFQKNDLRDLVLAAFRTADRKYAFLIVPGNQHE
jgi:DNA-binding NtrC family response regulator